MAESSRSYVWDEMVIVDHQSRRVVAIVPSVA
jgi:hypothetical protein